MNKCEVLDSNSQLEHVFVAPDGGTVEITEEGGFVKVIGINKEGKSTIFAIFYRPIRAEVSFSQGFAMRKQ